MTRILALLLIPTLAACNLDKIAEPAKPSGFEEHIKRLEVLEANHAVMMAGLATRETVTVEVAPVVSREPEPLALIVPEPQPCHAVFRISYCDENGNEVML